jgi:hypothetical protein
MLIILSERTGRAISGLTTKLLGGEIVAATSEIRALLSTKRRKAYARRMGGFYARRADWVDSG